MAEGSTYRFVVAGDPEVWDAAAESPSRGLLELPAADRITAWEELVAGGSVVVICGAREEPQVRLEVSLARQVLDTSRIAMVSLPLGPLGQLVAGECAEELLASGSGWWPAAQIIRLLPDLAATFFDAAVLASVASLDVPGVRVRHHVESYLPGSRRFLVQVSPQAVSVRASGLRKGHRIAGLTGHGFDSRLGTRTSAWGPGPVPPRLLKLLETPDAPPARATTAALSNFWSDPEATEIVVRPDDLPGWMQDHGGHTPRTVPCSWCAELLTTDLPGCPFCGQSAASSRSS